MKEDIDLNFVKRIVPVPNITSNEVTDIDGWINCAGQEPNKQNVTVLGGYFGQLMIVLNAIAKEYIHLDMPIPN